MTLRSEQSKRHPEPIQEDPVQPPDEIELNHQERQLGILRQRQSLDHQVALERAELTRYVLRDATVVFIRYFGHRFTCLEITPNRMNPWPDR